MQRDFGPAALRAQAAIGPNQRPTRGHDTAEAPNYKGLILVKHQGRSRSARHINFVTIDEEDVCVRWKSQCGESQTQTLARQLFGSLRHGMGLESGEIQPRFACIVEIYLAPSSLLCLAPFPRRLSLIGRPARLRFRSGRALSIWAAAWRAAVMSPGGPCEEECGEAGDDGFQNGARKGLGEGGRGGHGLGGSGDMGPALSFDVCSAAST